MRLPVRLPLRLVGGFAALAVAGATVTAATTATSTAATTAAGTTATSATLASTGYTERTLHLWVHIGPKGAQRCNIVFDLYRPDGATRSHPAPAVLTTNGFGGSKESQAGVGKRLARRGYVTLAYSGVGFGGSSCRIELDSFAWDGRAAAQLVRFLGGGSRATNGARVDYVEHDRRAHDGRHYRYDPVVGMIGGSYGGGAQLAAAAVDPRIDALIPIITWNNLAYSLAPNNAGLTGSSLATTVPGIVKAGAVKVLGVGAGWLNLLWYSGTTSTRTAPLPPSGCPNFDAFMCPIHTQLLAEGYPDAVARKKLRTTSISSRMGRLKIPVLLEQGENDSLFDLQEAVATYRALKRQHTPVKLVWQSWGHSGGSSSAGETAVLNGLNDAWFRYYLERTGPKPVMNFSFFRPWVADPAHAYAVAPSYPIGTTRRFFLSAAASATAGVDVLAPTATDVTDGNAAFTTPGVGDPQSVTQQVDIGGVLSGMNNVPITDPAGTAASYETAPLASAVDVVGVPRVRVEIASPAARLTAGPAGTLGLFFRIEDVAADGTVSLPDGLVSAARFSTSDAGTTVTVSLPGIAHRFPAGHRIRLVLAGSDSSYALPNPAVGVTVTTDSADPGVLDLPVAAAGSYRPLR
ncbi:MAG: alpha/beta fold hydrolase [Nocardioides sp.]